MRVMRPLIAFAALASLAACASAPSSTASLGLPQPTVSSETVRVAMDIRDDDNGLTWAQEAQLLALADEYKARGHGPLVIGFPDGAGNEDAAMFAIANARTFLYGQGLSWRSIVGAPYDARGEESAPVTFAFTRYLAHAPDCPQGWDDLARNPSNARNARMGCAMAANLAAMISDPHDLLAPRGMDAPDASRRHTVLERYRAGEPTASTRTENESGAVSSVNN
jgi:pilus assembly protein CpaD